MSIYLYQHDTLEINLRRIAADMNSKPVEAYVVRKALRLVRRSTLRKELNDRVRLARRLAAHHGKAA